MTIRKLQVISVPVSDQDRAKQFYVDVLGLDVVADAELPGQRWLQVTSP